MSAKQRNPRTLLVTGGAGFIGSAFIRYLLSPDSGYTGSCMNLDALTYAGNLANLYSVENNPRYKFIHGSICDKPFLENLFRRASY